MSNLHDRYSHRKGNKALSFVCPDGTPLKNVQVIFQQTSHDFLFGASEFTCLPYVNNELDGEEKEQADIMFEKFFALFNSATLPFYWGRFEPEQGQPDTVRMLNAAKWMSSRGCTLKGHPLCWHTVTAPWLLDMTDTEIINTQLQRIHRDVSGFAGAIDMWDVINEVVIMPIFDKYVNGITRICKELGRVDLVKKVFTAAREANPNAVLLINDFNISEDYALIIEECLDAGIVFDAIGIQSHMHQGYWGIEKTMKVLERFSRFNLPLHFTENTIVSGHIMPSEIIDLNDYKVDEWPTTPEGEERQAIEVANHYETLFAHPLVESITWWNFVDGRWLGAPAGLLRKDSSAKPAFDELHRLIKKDWWTPSVTLTTDENGMATLSGYRGEYQVSCHNTSKTIKLNKLESKETIVIE